MRLFTALCRLLLALGLTAAGAAQQKTYDGYRVYDVAVTSRREADRLHQLAAAGDYELWNEDDASGSLQLQVGPAGAAALEAALNSSALPFRLRIADVQRLIDAQSSENDADRARAGRRLDHLADGGDTNGIDSGDDTTVDGLDLGVYHRFGEIEAFLQGLPKRHPRHAELRVIGRTHEGRALHMLRLRQDVAAPADKPVMWIDCGIHAREWVSPAICLYAIGRLLGEDRHWLAEYDWHLVPVMNPDGYEYSHTHDRLWRKNRQPNLYCTGVDLNRNFAARWGTFGVTFLECGMTFPGYRSFSERESRAVRDAVLRDRRRIAAFTSVHSYGQLWLLPYGYSWFASKDIKLHRRVGRAATRAMRAVNGVHYRYGISSRLLYLDSGTSTDWAYSAGVKHSVAVEARDKGFFGFLLPRRLILPTAREVWAGLLAQARLLVR